VGVGLIKIVKCKTSLWPESHQKKYRTINQCVFYLFLYLISNGGFFNTTFFEGYYYKNVESIPYLFAITDNIDPSH